MMGTDANRRVVKAGLFTLLLGFFWVSGCASEDWDNPLDRQGNTWRAPCENAPPEMVAQCVFWEDFHDLSRWHIPETRSSHKVRLGSGSGEGNTMILPACSGQPVPRAETEVELPEGTLRLLVRWRPVEAEGGRLSLRVGTLEKSFSPASSGESGWYESTLDLSGAAKYEVIRLYNTYDGAAGCGKISVDRVWIRTG